MQRSCVRIVLLNADHGPLFVRALATPSARNVRPQLHEISLRLVMPSSWLAEPLPALQVVSAQAGGGAAGGRVARVVEVYSAPGACIGGEPATLPFGTTIDDEDDLR